MGTVKTTKPTRAQRAAQTRRRMIQAATHEFVSRGYAATTMNDIAARADVAVQTLYYSFRTKALLLREAMETAALGANAPAPITERPWMAEIIGGASAQRILALTAEHGTDVYHRAAPLWPAVRAASLTDPTIDEYWRDVRRARRDGMRQIVAKVAEHSALRTGLSEDKATDLVDTLAGHDTFQGLVLEAGWRITEFKAWLFETLVQQLLGPVPLERSAAEGLSFEQSLHH